LFSTYGRQPSGYGNGDLPDFVIYEKKTEKNGRDVILNDSPASVFAGPRGAISVVRVFCMAKGRVTVYICFFHLIAQIRSL